MYRIKQQNNAGNVLFIILLCVALFAALAYVVTNSTRSGGGDASRENNVLMASQVTQYGAELQTAIMRMKISSGCTDEQISFENPILSGYTNPNAPSDFRCHVFRAEGGGVVFRQCSGMPQPCVANWSYIGIVGIRDIGIQNNPELLVTISIPLELCLAINQKLGLPGSTDSDLAIDYNYADAIRFAGSYSFMNAAPDDGGNMTPFLGKQSACLKSRPDSVHHGLYYYYHVLIEK